MICPKCGSQIENDAVFCSKCGARVHSEEYFDGQKNKSNNMALMGKKYNNTHDKTFSHVGIILCTIVEIFSAICLPIYYYENSTYQIYVHFLGKRRPIELYFGTIDGDNIIRYNLIAIVIIIILSIYAIIMVFRRKNQYISYLFSAIIVVMSLHFLCFYLTLPIKGTISSGFIIIILMSLIGIICSNIYRHH